MATALSALRTRCRQRADMVNSQFVSDSELNSFINASYAELYDLLVQTYEDYFVTSESFTLTTSDSGVRALAADFYKLKGVDYQLNGEFITLYPYNWNTRNLRQRAVNRLYMGDYDLSYKVLGSNIRFEPSDNATGTFRLWYIPSYTALSADGDNVDSVISRNNWEEYIVIDAAIKMLEKEESNTQHLEREKRAMIMRINSAAGDRDADQPERVSDVSRQDYLDGWLD
jgi:hypothetical protein